jgi:hypothetical protein
LLKSSRPNSPLRLKVSSALGPYKNEKESHMFTRYSGGQKQEELWGKKKEARLKKVQNTAGQNPHV